MRQATSRCSCAPGPRRRRATPRCRLPPISPSPTRCWRRRRRSSQQNRDLHPHRGTRTVHQRREGVREHQHLLRLHLFLRQRHERDDGRRGWQRRCVHRRRRRGPAAVRHRRQQAQEVHQLRRRPVGRERHHLVGQAREHLLPGPRRGRVHRRVVQHQVHPLRRLARTVDITRTSRLACQITLADDLDGLTVRIPGAHADARRS